MTQLGNQRVERKPFEYFWGANEHLIMKELGDIKILVGHKRVNSCCSWPIDIGSVAGG